MIDEPSMLERMARILFWMNDGGRWVAADALTREKYLKEARAVLEEMREPDRDMIDRGRDVGPDAPYGLHEVRERWAIMINTAIEEGLPLIRGAKPSAGAESRNSD